jgi:hypothetical protein
MLDMTGFEYKDRNTIEFTGAFGKVELMFFEMVTETDELGEDRIIMSHFVAYLWGNKENGMPTMNISGITAHDAVINLYRKHAEYLALEDLGRI